MSKPGVYGYWEHLDFIVDVAERNGIYIAMDCIWGSMINQMDTKKAAALGTFLAKRYKDKPNIIWMIWRRHNGATRSPKCGTLWHAP